MTNPPPPSDNLSPSPNLPLSADPSSSPDLPPPGDHPPSPNLPPPADRPPTTAPSPSPNPPQLPDLSLSPDLPPTDHRSSADLSSFAELDLDRTARRGFAEAIYCEGKTTAQVATIASALRERAVPTLFTRASSDHAQAILSRLPDAMHYPDARLVAWPAELPAPNGGLVVVVCAGTSDLPVAREAALTAAHLGRHTELVVDVGVAGLHRILAKLELLRSAQAIVVVAGMDGALPSVVAGLVSAPVIACPTSVGYGASFGGVAALLAMLTSCAPGVAVVNIDNGYGAGHLAAQITAPN